ncbi:MAG: glycosyltransferase family 39 protein [Candidatus Solibacter usitatus]|nr:glycosyltransferase family 39 protein [Candidatus Solibacter usitatus]
MFLLLATATARTAGVHATEAWFADPAYHLVHHGCLCTTLIESSGFWLAGADRHTYWILPLHALVQSVWYRLFGFSLWTLRSLSIVSGALALGAWFAIVRKLSGTRTALLAALLIAIDYRFIQASVSGRMDMLCAAMGAAAVALYVTLRERNLTGAVLGAHALMAAACFTHPCGVLLFAGLVAMMWSLDRAHLSPGLFALAVVPYLIAAALYGIYVLQAPHDFVRQFQGNITGIAGELGGGTRFHSLLAPLAGLLEEWQARYLPAFGGPFSLQLFILFLYAAGTTSSVLDPDFRTGQPARCLWMLAAIPVILLWLLDGTRQYKYLVHVVPAAAAFTALWLANRFNQHRRVRAIVLSGVAAVQLAAIGAEVRRNVFAQDYQPAVAFLKSRSSTGSLVMGDASVAFGLGFDTAFVDDFRLGYFSRKQPQFFVTTGFYQRWIERRQFDDPALYRHIQDTLARNYQSVFQNAGYTIYARRETGSGTAPSGEGSLTNGVANK